MNVDELSSIAQQLVARVRDDDPQANQRWLHAMTGPADREALLYVLAAAIPDDRTWSELTMWTYGDGRPDTPERVAARRRDLADALDRVEMKSGRLDEVAVERACHGEKVRLSTAERAAAVAKMTRRGLAANEIAHRLGVTRRTVTRLRKRSAA